MDKKPLREEGKELFPQPCKMMDKICFKARMGLVMQCYLQQGLGSLLTAIQSDDFSKDATVQKAKKIFLLFLPKPLLKLEGHVLSII